MRSGLARVGCVRTRVLHSVPKRLGPAGLHEAWLPPSQASKIVAEPLRNTEGAAASNRQQLTGHLSTLEM
jgi:hypothetical protein